MIPETKIMYVVIESTFDSFWGEGSDEVVAAFGTEEAARARVLELSAASGWKAAQQAREAYLAARRERERVLAGQVGFTTFPSSEVKAVYTSTDGELRSDPRAYWTPALRKRVEYLEQELREWDAENRVEDPDDRFPRYSVKQVRVLVEEAK